jgi:hypothetical protein
MLFLADFNQKCCAMAQTVGYRPVIFAKHYVTLTRGECKKYVLFTCDLREDMALFTFQRLPERRREISLLRGRGVESVVVWDIIVTTKIQLVPRSKHTPCRL